jgi:molybdopterin synthase catalytic subunit
MTKEEKRRQLLELLKRKEPIWKDEDHPELKVGAAAWVRKIRAESEARFQKIRKQRDRP